jgi:hypothetical protein
MQRWREEEEGREHMPATCRLLNAVMVTEKQKHSAEFDNASVTKRGGQAGKPSPYHV